MVFTAKERAYLTNLGLGVLATLGPDGTPQAKPVAFDVDANMITIGGPAMRESRKARNVERDDRVSFVAHDESREPVGPGGQRGRGIEVRGTATVEERDGRDVIVVRPRRLVAWNIDGPGPNFRTVTE